VHTAPYPCSPLRLLITASSQATMHCEAPLFGDIPLQMLRVAWCQSTCKPRDHL